MKCAEESLHSDGLLSAAEPHIEQLHADGQPAGIETGGWLKSWYLDNSSSCELINHQLKEHWLVRGT